MYAIGQHVMYKGVAARIVYVYTNAVELVTESGAQFTVMDSEPEQPTLEPELSVLP